MRQEPGATTPRQQANLGVGLGEARAVAGHAQIAGQREIESTAGRHPIDGGDDRFVETREAIGEGLDGVPDIFLGDVRAIVSVRAHGADVTAAAKAAASAGQHHRADILARRAFVDTRH